MRRYPFYQVDAFTDRPLEGNPCAVLLDTEELSAAQMQAIALEMNLAETAFVRASSTADFGARYFTPAEEIPFAGHPTLSVACTLVETGRLPLNEPRQSFSLELRDGPIQVELLSSQEVSDGGGSGRRLQSVVVELRRPSFGRTYEPQEVLPIFGLSADDRLESAPIQTTNTGTPQLMIPLRDLDALRRARLDPDRYLRLKSDGDFFSPHLFCLQGFTPDGRTAARHMGVFPDLPEDPFTGSATGGMAAYLWHHRLIDRPRFVAEQGHDMGRPGRAEVEVIGDPEEITGVRVGGRAVILLRGELEL